MKLPEHLIKLALPEICRQRRIEKGITQRNLAEKLGIRKATLSEFETGKRGISSKTLELILKELKIELK
jgi:transcriptional regulator with XRE-family HTH domain